MKRLIHILLIAIAVTIVAPAVSVIDSRVAAVYAVDAKAKAKAQKEKEKAKKQREREKAKAAAQKQKEKAAAQKKKEQAKAAAQKQKAKTQQAKSTAKPAAKPAAPKAAPVLSAEEEKAQYMEQVAAIDKANAKAEAYNSRDITHRIGAWGQIGYSNLFTSGIAYEAATPNPVGFEHKDKGFVGGGIGLGYQMRYRQMILTTGLEFNTYNSVMAFSNQPDGTMLLQYGMSPYESTMTYHYAFDSMRDKLIGGFVQIPILCGMELSSFPLFWQAGLKVGMGVMGQSTVKGNLTTTIEDKELIDGLKDMYSHTLVTDEAVQRPASAVKFGLNLAASAEIGVNLDQWINAIPRLRASLFADYGILNSLNYKAADGAQDIPMQMTVAANPLDYPTNSTLATTSAADAQVHPFLVGAKVAVWFDLPRKQKQITEHPAIPASRLGVYLYDPETELALSGVAVDVIDAATGKSMHKNTNRQGMLQGRFAPGQYRISATKNGYVPSDTLIHMVEEFTFDTLRLPLERMVQPVVHTLCLNIYDEETHAPIEASVRLVAISDPNISYAAQSSDDGFVETPLTAGDYIAHLSGTGYMSKDDTIHYGVIDTMDVFMQHIQEGIKVKIENLFFATNKTYILPQSEQSMSDLATFLLENPSVTIHITGHTDAVGSDEANQILSEGRANAVRDDLIKRGVAAERLSAEGKGEKEPVADNDTEEGRQLNRRVEFVITGTEGKDIQQVY